MRKASGTHIFLDWFGVCATTSPTPWRNSQAAILTDWFGGKASDWCSVHDIGFRWWLEEWKRKDSLLRRQSRFKATFQDIEIGWMRTIFREAGLPLAWTDTQLYLLDRELVRQIGSRMIPRNHPWLPYVLRDLKVSGYTLHLSSGGDSTFLWAILDAGNLKQYITDVYSPGEVHTVKASRKYWVRTFHAARTRPRDSFVVDDRPDYLEYPARLGAFTILVGPKKKSDIFTPDWTIRSLRELPRLLSGSIRNENSSVHRGDSRATV